MKTIISLSLFIFLFPFFLNATESNALNIKSDRVEIFRSKNEIIFTDRVEAKKDGFTLNSDKMIVTYTEDSNNKMNISNIKLIDNIKFVDEKNTVVGDDGLYDVKKNMIYLKKNIKANQGGITIFAEEFKYNVVTRESDIIGNKNKDERVTIIIDNLEDVNKLKGN